MLISFEAHTSILAAATLMAGNKNMGTDQAMEIADELLEKAEKKEMKRLKERREKTNILTKYSEKINKSIREDPLILELRKKRHDMERMNCSNQEEKIQIQNKIDGVRAEEKIREKELRHDLMEEMGLTEDDFE